MISQFENNFNYPSLSEEDDFIETFFINRLKYDYINNPSKGFNILKSCTEEQLFFIINYLLEDTTYYTFPNSQKNDVFSMFCSLIHLMKLFESKFHLPFNFIFLHELMSHHKLLLLLEKKEIINKIFPQFSFEEIEKFLKNHQTNKDISTIDPSIVFDSILSSALLKDLCIQLDAVTQYEITIFDIKWFSHFNTRSGFSFHKNFPLQLGWAGIRSLYLENPFRSNISLLAHLHYSYGYQTIKNSDLYQLYFSPNISLDDVLRKELFFTLQICFRYIELFNKENKKLLTHFTKVI